MRCKSLVSALFLSVTASIATAQPNIVYNPAERTDTTGFAGISIPVAPNPKLRVELGLRQVTVGSAGGLQGGELRLTFDPWSLGGVQLRVMALKGSVDHSGMLGGGWDFATGKPFGSLGVALPHISGRADIGLDGLAPQYAIGLDSLKEVAVPPYVDDCGNLVQTIFRTGC